MKKAIIICSVLLGLIVGTAVLAPHAAFASPQSDICNGIGAASGSGGCKTTSGPTLTDIIAAVINILSLIVGIAAVIMIIIGGSLYVTSNGDSGKISNAKNTIIYALVGLVITAFAQAIVKFVLDKTGI